MKKMTGISIIVVLLMIVSTINVATADEKINASEGEPPIADFIFSPEEPTTEDIIQFNDTSVDPDGNIVDWWWEFGSEDDTSREQNPTFQFTEPGTYQVALTVFDDNETPLQDTKLRNINVTLPVEEEPIFEKTVYDEGAGEWVEEIDAYIGQTVEFNLKFTYYGDNLTEVNLKIVDNLPLNLEYDSGDATNVSEDKKTVEFLYEDVNISDEDVISLSLIALVTDNCSGCINTATILVYNDPCCPIIELTDTASVSSMENDAPNPPVLSGPESGLVGEEITFTATVSDPNEHSVYLLVEFGDGSDSGWLGPYANNSEVEVKHTYDSADTFDVRAKVKDSLDEESDYSNTVSIEIISPPNKMINMRQSLLGLGRVKVTLTNNGEVDLENVDWEMSITGGILKRINVTNNGTIDNLAIEKSVAVISGGMFGQGSISGFGQISGEIKVSTEGYSNAKQIKGFALGRLVIVFPLAEIQPEE
jgi:hypothetical protein